MLGARTGVDRGVVSSTSQGRDGSTHNRRLHIRRL